MKSLAINRSFDLDYEIALDMDGDVKPLSKKRINELAHEDIPIEFFADHPFLFLVVDPTSSFHPIRVMGRYAGWASISQKAEDTVSLSEVGVKENETILGEKQQRPLFYYFIYNHDTVIQQCSIHVIVLSPVSSHSP